MIRSQRCVSFVLGWVVLFLAACNGNPEPASPKPTVTQGVQSIPVTPEALLKPLLPETGGLQDPAPQSESETEMGTQPAVRPHSSVLPGVRHPAEPGLPPEAAVPSPTVDPTRQPEWLETDDENAPPPAAALPVPRSVQVLVLLGADGFSWQAARTDTIILVFLDSRSGQASLVSIPRDLYVYVPGYGMQRINTAFIRGGIELLYATLEYNLGVRPSHYALAYFDDFGNFINDLGGIEVEVNTPLPDDCGGIPPGTVFMDGATALCYVRSRYSSSDFDRSRRQQEVLRIIFKRFVSLGSLPHLADWYARYSATVRSDLALADLVDFVPLALRLHTRDGFHHFQIGAEQVSGWRTPVTGASVVLPHSEKVRAVLEAAVAAAGIYSND